jgi:hypothetical protein
MGDCNQLIALIIVLAIVYILYVAYRNCKLDRYLAPRHRKCGAPGAGNFVGSMAQFPWGVPCAFRQTTPDGKPTSWFTNRCNAT